MAVDSRFPLLLSVFAIVFCILNALSIQSVETYVRDPSIHDPAIMQVMSAGELMKGMPFCSGKSDASLSVDHRAVVCNRYVQHINHVALSGDDDMAVKEGKLDFFTHEVNGSEVKQSAFHTIMKLHGEMSMSDPNDQVSSQLTDTFKSNVAKALSQPAKAEHFTLPRGSMRQFTSVNDDGLTTVVHVFDRREERVDAHGRRQLFTCFIALCAAIAAASAEGSALAGAIGGAEAIGLAVSGSTSAAIGGSVATAADTMIVATAAAASSH